MDVTAAPLPTGSVMITCLKKLYAIVEYLVDQTICLSHTP